MGEAPRSGSHWGVERGSSFREDELKVPEGPGGVRPNSFHWPSVPDRRRSIPSRSPKVMIEPSAADRQTPGEAGPASSMILCRKSMNAASGRNVCDESSSPVTLDSTRSADTAGVARFPAETPCDEWAMNASRSRFPVHDAFGGTVGLTTLGVDRRAPQRPTSAVLAARSEASTLERAR